MPAKPNKPKPQTAASRVTPKKANTQAQKKLKKVVEDQARTQLHLQTVIERDLNKNQQAMPINEDDEEAAETDQEMEGNNEG